ncbi:MAG: cobalt-precorrin 5A hydrolase [Lachnospiraceae bacterium]|nr:cobalt-precorrin 5A hydrolase [Lachnospiraceae bacterium]
MDWKPEGKIAVICFTREGARICRRILKGLREDGICCEGYGKSRSFSSEDLAPEGEKEGLLPVQEPLTEWTGRQFQQSAGLIFVGAAGIAVRGAAPWIADKFRDPALVVVDEKGQFAIPVLSGHVGGANDLARRISRYVGAVPVITTATDVENRFAVDVFARERGLWISDREEAKQISADILEGKPVGWFSDFPMAGEIPKGCVKDQKCRHNISIGIYERRLDDGRDPEDKRIGILYLVPKAVTLGIGCRKGIGREILKQEVLGALKAHGILPQSVCRVATIDVKKNEDALLYLCETMGWEFCCFSPEELNALDGAFAHSDFVERTVGVGNVCERAAVLGSGHRQASALILRKQQQNGVTLAAAGSIQGIEGAAWKTSIRM